MVSFYQVLRDTERERELSQLKMVWYKEEWQLNISAFSILLSKKQFGGRLWVIFKKRKREELYFKKHFAEKYQLQGILGG